MSLIGLVPIKCLKRFVAEHRLRNTDIQRIVRSCLAYCRTLVTTLNLNDRSSVPMLHMTTLLPPSYVDTMSKKTNDIQIQLSKILFEDDVGFTCF
jgi:hypothetical protein